MSALWLAQTQHSIQSIPEELEAQEEKGWTCTQDDPWTRPCCLCLKGPLLMQNQSPYSSGLFVKGSTTVFITTATTVLYPATKTYCAQQTP